MTDWNKFIFKDYCDLKNTEIENLPNGVNISTMTASIRETNIKYNFENIFNYLELNENDILAIVRNHNDRRSLISLKKKKKDLIKKKRLFFNQLSVIVRVNEGKTNNLDKEKKVNFKLFVNGSIQMSGIKNITFANRAINKLFHKLSEVKAIKYENKKKIEKIRFVENLENLTTNNFKIDMINSNYKVRIKINRPQFYQLLLKKKIKSSYEKAIRACVIIKYSPKSDNIENKEISVFVFQKGNIIITGARSKNQIMETFNYINNIIFEHIDTLSIPEEKESEIMKYFNEVMVENSHKLDKIFKNGNIPKLFNV